MENKLDVLTKKLYEEGVSKAEHDASVIVAEAEKKAQELLLQAEKDAKSIVQKAEQSVENLKSKADAEMSLSARQAVAALKQQITEMLSLDVSKAMVNAALKDKEFVQELIITIVKKWDVNSGSIDLSVILSDEDKVRFDAYVASKYKDLLDKGLKISTGDVKEGFAINPKNGGYTLNFSDELFESFFNQYMKSLTKDLLYK